MPRLLIDQNSLVIYQAPGQSIILGAYHGKTDIITLFSSDARIEYDRRDRTRKLAILSARLTGAGWRVPELLGEMGRADNLCFSELAQIRMPTWTRGRAALVGDAACCASPAAGMGGSLAIDGDHAAAFRTYDEGFRPFVEQVQAAAVGLCKDVALGAMAG